MGPLRRLRDRVEMHGTAHSPTFAAFMLARRLDSGGWLRSRREGRPVDGHGRPLPWLPYAVIDLLERVPPDARIFEFGSGMSTAWWSARTQSVTACEHDPDWLAVVKGQVDGMPNVDVILRPLDGDAYPNAVAQRGPYDVVVIDGRRRSDCSEQAAKALSGRGVIVWDNSDRAPYQTGLERLRGLGYRRLDISGLAPGALTPQQTSILYREGNCLGL